MNWWSRIGIGVGISVIALIALGFFAASSLRTALYPEAPPMPPSVDEPMGQILVRLEAILQTNAPHVLRRLQPGLSSDDIVRIEGQHRLRLPEDIKAIYQWHNGSPRSTNLLSNDFIPTHWFLPLEEALAERTAGSLDRATLLQRTFYRIFAGHRDSWVCLFSDGAGDGYWFDLRRKTSQGAIFYNFTETGTFQFFPSAENLMAGIARCYEQRAFFVKEGSSPPELTEDFEKAAGIWNAFGVSNLSAE
jgi:cell wall assembly regulator SMI1